MALYEITTGVLSKDPLVKVSRTTFAAQGIQERAHLQAAIRDHIELVGENLFVIAEEFGNFEGANRRIDLLCIDKEGRLVVVELKRTADGGHMELQALRYAAMVSTMTFEQVVSALANYRAARAVEDPSEKTAGDDLASFLELEEDDEPAVSRDVGIVLVSEDFNQEITTTVLWLNEFHGFDIRCVRISPYVLEGRVLLDVQQAIPLPEATDYTIRVREKEHAERKVKGASSQDRTRFVIRSPAGATEPLPKRWAMLRLVEGLIGAGVEVEPVRSAMPASKTLVLPGSYADADELWAAIRVENPQKSDTNRRRWHLEDPIELSDGTTLVVANQWGTNAREIFAALLGLAPQGFSVTEESGKPIRPTSGISGSL